MKKDIFVPFMILLLVTVGCARLSEIAKGPSNTGSASNSNAEITASGDDNAPAASGEFAPSSDAKADIERLSDRFTTIKSYRATMSGKGEMPMQTELEFVSPDRYRIRTGNTTDVIIIGKSTYMKIADKWQKIEMPLGDAMSQMRTAFNKEAMKWVSDVKYVGDDTVNGKPAYLYTYHGKGPDNIGENEAKLWVAKSNGLPVKVEALYKSGNLRSMTIEYDYEAPVTIEPPIN